MAQKSHDGMLLGTFPSTSADFQKVGLPVVTRTVYFQPVLLFQLVAVFEQEQYLLENIFDFLTALKLVQDAVSGLRRPMFPPQTMDWRLTMLTLHT